MSGTFVPDGGGLGKIFPAQSKQQMKAKRFSLCYGEIEQELTSIFPDGHDISMGRLMQVMGGNRGDYDNYFRLLKRGESHSDAMEKSLVTK